MRKLIKTFGLIFLSLLLTSSILPVPSAVSQPSDQTQVLGDARLSLIQGDVAIQTKDTGSEWGAATINIPLPPGTKIWDPEKGRSEIQFFGGSYLRASKNTEVDITSLSMGSNGDVIQVEIPQGRSYVNYAGSNVQNSVFQVDTPIASITAYEPSRFEVDIYNDGSAEVSVLRGSVYVQSQNGSTRVDAGTMLSMGQNQNAELFPVRPEDAWISWNLSRDSALARTGESRNYLPASLDVYSNDFDAYGRWVSTADYGYVWSPTVVVADWTPYRLGRWCWIGGDYVWVSYEPWGWAPYHYGRWAFLPNTGWCWVPPPATAVYWGPGFVAWIDTPTYVSWVPLAPRETYYGYGYYGPWSVDIRKTNINRINLTNVYVNARMVNAVTVVSRQTFLTGKPQRVANAPANPFVAGTRIIPGRPNIRPVRATSLPQPLKAVPQRALPSRQVLTTAAKIAHRPVALHRDVSVFHPGHQAPSMHVTRVEHPRPATALQKGQPQVKGKEVRPPSVQKGPTGEPSAPSTHREFGVAPQQPRQPATPPAQKKELGPSGQTGKAVPLVQRKEVRPPSVQKGPTGGPPSTHREFGVAPQQPRQPATPPVHRKELNPPAQISRPAPPPVRREAIPSPQMSRPAPPPPKVPSGPSLQRNMGVAPPHVGQPSPPPAPRQPQVVRPGAPPSGRKER
jgi:hypothetical protein